MLMLYDVIDGRRDVLVFVNILAFMLYLFLTQPVEDKSGNTVWPNRWQHLLCWLKEQWRRFTNWQNFK